MLDTSQFTAHDNKNRAFAAIATYLERLSIIVASTDFNRPWGGFLVIDDASTQKFIDEFFPTRSREDIATGLSLTPKILVAAPGKRLSWQYHHRREEIWSVVHGPVGVATSLTNTEGAVEKKQTGDIVAFGAEVRHRLIGLESYGIVAELWKHIDSKNPSDESDIVRVQDDFLRN